MSFPLRSRIAKPLLSSLLLCACTAGDGRREVGVTVDTLANGALHVRNAAEGAWLHQEEEPWRLAEDLRIGVLSGEPAYMFGQLRNVLPRADGAIWALESQIPELRLFDATGRHVRTVGRRGDGPGEFSGNTCAFPGPDDEIWVEDVRRRWQRFDSEGALLGQYPSTSNIGCGIRRWTPDGQLLAVNVERADPSDPLNTTSYYISHRLATDGSLEPADTIRVPTLPAAPRVVWVAPDGRYRIIGPPPLVHRPMVVLSPAGEFWTSEGGGAYTLVRQSLNGDTLMVIDRQHEPVTVPDSMRARLIQEFQPQDYTAEGGFDEAQVPRVFPPFDQIQFSTDGTVWVRRQVRDGGWAFDVFSPEGRYLGPVQAPERLDRILIHHITPDHIYGVARDELDLSYVVRLAIRKPRI